MQTLYELDSLSHAKNYQKWMYESVQSHLGSRILELGSGIGNLSTWLPTKEILVLSDVESQFIEHLNGVELLKNERTKIIQLDLSKPIADQVSHFQLDTIVSFNVMEHIEDDFASLKEQVQILKKSSSKGVKRVVIFAPAFQFAYGELDVVFKHHRRYSIGNLRKHFADIDPTIKVSARYFNLLSILPWIVQGRIMKSKEITPKQIKLIESIIPFWKSIDQLLTGIMRFPLGQSVICVAEIK